MTRFRKLSTEELARKDVEAFRSARKTQVIIVLENVRSLQNVGSVFRTADAFLLEKIYLCGITAKPPHRDIRKTALGATESVNWEYRDSAAELIQSLSDSCSCFAIEQTENATLLQDFEPPKDRPVVLVFGNEVKGVSQEVIDSCQGVVEIPQLGTKHSLNIAVSVGIVVWNIFSRWLRT